MQDILSDIWYSYLTETSLRKSKRRKEISESLEKNATVLRAKADEEGKRSFEQYEEGVFELSALFEKEAFLKGVRFAAQFLVAALYETEREE